MIIIIRSLLKCLIIYKWDIIIVYLRGWHRLQQLVEISKLGFYWYQELHKIQRGCGVVRWRRTRQVAAPAPIASTLRLHPLPPSFNGYWLSQRRASDHVRSSRLLPTLASFDLIRHFLKKIFFFFGFLMCWHMRFLLMWSPSNPDSITCKSLTFNILRNEVWNILKFF